MATVDKNFRIKNGLAVEGTTATVNGKDILTKETGDSYIINLIGGSADTANTPNTVVKRDGNGNFAAGTITATFIGDVTGTVSSISNHSTSDLTEGSNLYFTNQRAIDAGDGVFDGYGAAAAARTAAENTAANDATTKVAAEAALRVSGDAASVLTAANDATAKADAAQLAAISAAAADATTKADAAKAGAEATAAAALSSAISTEVTNRNTAISTAVDNLVDGAPNLLNTLNELAAAINDDANYTTTITTALGTKANTADVTTSLAAKQDNLIVGDGLDLTGANLDVNSGEMINKVITGVSGNSYGIVGNATYLKVTNPTGYHSEVDLDVSALESKLTMDGFASQTDVSGAQTAAEGHADGLASDILDGTSAFTEINVNDLVSQRAAQGLVATAQTGSSMMSWAKADYGTAKAWVKFATATHSQISEFLLTTDSSGNIAITEFGMITSNGILGSVGASYLNGNIAIEVDTVHAATTVTIVATLIK